jgi:hypothetical protein
MIFSQFLAFFSDKSALNWRYNFFIKYLNLAKSTWSKWIVNTRFGKQLIGIRFKDLQIIDRDPRWSKLKILVISNELLGGPIWVKNIEIPVYFLKLQIATKKWNIYYNKNFNHEIQFSLFKNRYLNNSS